MPDDRGLLERAERWVDGHFPSLSWSKREEVALTLVQFVTNEIASAELERARNAKADGD